MSENCLGVGSETWILTEVVRNTNGVLYTSRSLYTQKYTHIHIHMCISYIYTYICIYVYVPIGHTS